MDSEWRDVTGAVVLGLLVIALAMTLADIQTVAGVDVLAAAEFAFGFLAAGNFSVGVLSAGVFSVGIFAAGIFSVGVFAIGIFSIGLVSFGLYAVGFYAARQHFAE